MLTDEQLRDRLGIWGRWHPCSESDIRRLADSVVPMRFDERRESIGDNILAKMRQESYSCPPERSYSAEPPREAQEIERAVVDLSRYSRAVAVVLRAAYCLQSGVGFKLELLGGLPGLFTDPAFAIRDGKLKKARYYTCLEVGHAAVWAKIDQRKAA